MKRLYNVLQYTRQPCLALQGWPKICLMKDTTSEPIITACCVQYKQKAVESYHCTCFQSTPCCYTHKLKLNISLSALSSTWRKHCLGATEWSDIEIRQPAKKAPCRTTVLQKVIPFHCYNHLSLISKMTEIQNWYCT